MLNPGGVHRGVLSYRLFAPSDRFDCARALQLGTVPPEHDCYGDNF
jgi:hypothetical protein